ncbi:MAG: S46 family peptidase, partial [Candidatus Methylomirabilis sp.]|nr:S46 family peptidase [Deltaproteobacteria bacterium]
MRSKFAWFVLPLFAAALAAQPHKELGRMWTFEHMPLEWFKEAYDFEPTAEWVQKVQLSALKFGGGCSASFVSPRGLIMTNHHCARGNVAQVSPEGQDWLGDGHFAQTLADEVKLPGLEVRQTVSMRDVGAAMNAGLQGIVDATAHRAKLAANEAKILADANADFPDLEHKVVALFQGGAYQLYSFKVYSDIRLVGTPNLQSAKFGGDPDNFTYPRFGLDYTFVRAWENDRPADTSKHYLTWKTEGPKENETVFIIGNPGSTGRLKSIAQMEYLRDVQYPALVNQFKTILAQLYKRSEADPEQGKGLRTQILSLENSRKAVQGYLDGLRNDKVMAFKRAAEEKARDGVARSEELLGRLGNPWGELEQLVQRKRGIAAGAEKVSKAESDAMKDHEAALEKRIGEAFFGLYGTAISPDATLTLRISDGVVKGFDCNGTIAPWFT